MIKVYSAEDCKYCRDLKAYLTKKQVPFEVFDVGKNDEFAREMRKISGQSGIPVSVIGDEVVVGFDIAKIDHALAAIS